jgi:hypothetical protein
MIYVFPVGVTRTTNCLVGGSFVDVSQRGIKVLPGLYVTINAPDRIRTRDLWLWYHIELHALTNSTQKLKLIGKGRQFTYTPTLPLTCSLLQAAYVEY